MTEDGSEALGNYKGELARRLCAAYVSMYMGISLQYSYKRYAENEPIGDYWLSVADKVLADHGYGIGLQNALH